MNATAEYRELLAKFPPMPVRNEEEYRQTLSKLEKLMVPKPNKATGLLIEVLATLVEHYESQAFETPTVSPAQMLEHLLESRGETAAAVARATNIPRATLSNVLAGRRGISKTNAARLAAYFRVSPSAFLGA